MNSIRVLAPAKVNLRLEITGKRPDGYHELRTIFQKISLHDELDIARSERPGICLSVENADLPSDSSNLAWRAAELISRRCGTMPGVSIRLRKKIPAGAGLGGGSSDAAAVLEGCNRLFDLALEPGALHELGLCLGADVPFFLSAWPTANAAGIGEVLSPSSLAPEVWFLIVFPRFSISTAWAYATFSKDIILTKNRKNSSLPNSITALSDLAALLHNDFESVVLPRYPEITAIKENLLRSGALGALLSGSGSSVFGIFDTEEACGRAAAMLKKMLAGDIYIASNIREAS